MSDPKFSVGVYTAFFLLELSSMIIILWFGIPIFQHLLILEQITGLREEMALSAAVLGIQYSYWACLRYSPPFSIPKHEFFAHFLLFCGRLSFVFASSVFSVVAYRYSNLLEITVARAVLFIAVLFSIFCFSRHIEAIGNLMNTGNRITFGRKKPRDVKRTR